MNLESLETRKLLAAAHLGNLTQADVAASTEDFPSIELNPELLPEIHLDPPPA